MHRLVLVLLLCCTMGAVSSRERAVYTGLESIPAASCFHPFLEPLRAFVNGGSYGSGVFDLGTTGRVRTTSWSLIILRQWGAPSCRKIW